LPKANSEPEMNDPDLTADAALEADDSPVAVLQGLEEDRRTILTEKEYREMRQSVLDELCRGPRCRPSTVATFLVVGLLLFVLLVIGLALWIDRQVPDLMLPGVTAAALVAWAYLLRGYVKAVRQNAALSINRRLAELEELRARQLITREEYDRIYAAIHMSRVAHRTGGTSSQ